MDTRQFNELHPSEKQAMMQRGRAGVTKKQADLRKAAHMSAFEPSRADSIVIDMVHRTAQPTEKSQMALKSLAFKQVIE